MKGVVTAVSLAAVLLFAGKAMAQMKVVVVPLCGNFLEVAENLHFPA